LSIDAKAARLNSDEGAHPVFDDQMMLRIHDGLNDVADGSRSFATAAVVHPGGFSYAQRLFAMLLEQ
jgi:hypothetical protein